MPYVYNSCFLAPSDLPGSIRRGCRVVFAQDILNEITSGIANRPSREPMPTDEKEMRTYYTLAHSVLGTYIIEPSYNIGCPLLEETERYRLRDDVVAMGSNFLDHFKHEYQDAIDAWSSLEGLIHTGASEEDPIDDGTGCDCGEYHHNIHAGALMSFRWEVAQLADYLVNRFGLPKPGNRSCLAWHLSAWFSEGQPISEAQNGILRSAHDAFMGAKLITPVKTQGPPFGQQFNDYITVALVQAKLPRDESMRICHAIIDLVGTMRDAEVAGVSDLVAENADIRRKARAWCHPHGCEHLAREEDETDSNIAAAPNTNDEGAEGLAPVVDG